MSKKQTIQLRALRGYIIQAITMMWLASTAFMVFVFMAYKFQFGDTYMFIVVVGLTGVLTVMSTYFIQRIEKLIKHVWENL